MRTVVKAIAQGHAVDGDSRDVKRLEEYGFVVKDGNGGYRMRVPLFERWVRGFGY